MANKTTLGIIIGNRDFFPDSLVETARNEVIELCQTLNINPIVLDGATTKLGGVETYQEAQKCAALFKQHAENIIGVWVVLPNFGDEKGVADTLKLANLNVPVLIQAYPDDLDKMDVARRRDAWCGKISVCNNLYQYGIKYSLTTKHVVRPNDPSFIADLQNFIATCRVVKGLRSVRIGAIGARPGAFNTVRYSEKILQRNGISVVTCDLSEILGNANKMDKNDQAVKERLDQITSYAPGGKAPNEAMIQITKLDLALHEFMEAHCLDRKSVV